MDLLTLIKPQDPVLDGIQGNILKAHGRHHTANVFIRCNDEKQNEAKAWLRSLVTGGNAIVRSGADQLQSNALWKEECVDAGLFACIHISAAGYDYLFGKGTSLRFDDSSFQQGMKNAALNDPPADKWDAGLKEDNHFMLLLANAYVEALTASVVDIEQAILSFGNITTIEKGDALFNDDGAGIEHFGYADGISQPLFFDDEWEKYKTDNCIEGDNDPNIKFDPRAEAGLVLIKDPLGKDSNARGSYFVFRKLEQNVKGFKQAEEALADQLGLKGEDQERAGAMLVGRFEDGTPVQLYTEAQGDHNRETIECQNGNAVFSQNGQAIFNSALLNNFDYDFNDFSKCPYHAHIRKVNPRSGLKEGDGGMQEAKEHMMARRGIPFGSRTDDPNDGQICNKPEGGIGLLFMSYQASFIKQFEFIQKNWANTPASFHLPPDDPDGLDPIIGQGGPKYATKWGDKSDDGKQAGFGQFVHMKGGEYFFAPSMNFLKNIGTISIS